MPKKSSADVIEYPVEHDLDIVRMKRFTYCLEIFVRSEATVDLRKISCV